MSEFPLMIDEKNGKAYPLKPAAPPVSFAQTWVNIVSNRPDDDCMTSLFGIVCPKPKPTLPPAVAKIDRPQLTAQEFADVMYQPPTPCLVPVASLKRGDKIEVITGKISTVGNAIGDVVFLDAGWSISAKNVPTVMLVYRSNGAPPKDTRKPDFETWKKTGHHIHAAESKPTTPTAQPVASSDLKAGDTFSIPGEKGEFRVLLVRDDSRRGKWIITNGFSFHVSQIETVRRAKVTDPKCPGPELSPVPVQCSQPQPPAPEPKPPTLVEAAEVMVGGRPEKKLVNPVPGSQVIIFAGDTKSMSKPVSAYTYEDMKTGNLPPFDDIMAAYSRDEIDTPTMMLMTEAIQFHRNPRLYVDFFGDQHANDQAGD